GDMQLMYDVPEVEVYLRPAVDAATATALAPPWSPVPWPVLALMEQAVLRGFGAFSEREAQRRGIPWLDLVRDPRQRAALAAPEVVLGANGEVAAAGTSREVQTGRLVADLAGRLKPGTHRVLLALALNGNLIDPEVKVVAY